MPTLDDTVAIFRGIAGSDVPFVVDTIELEGWLVVAGVPVVASTFHGFMTGWMPMRNTALHSMRSPVPLARACERDSTLRRHAGRSSTLPNGARQLRLSGCGGCGSTVQDEPCGDSADGRL